MPVVNPLIKVVMVILAGSLVLSPTPAQNPQAGKITSTITKKIIDDATEKRKQQENPNYKPKRKMPIIAGYKKGRDPLPKGTNPKQTYKNIWITLKNDLGLK
jgi:CDP-diacylglycerol pyrophosphatase